MREPAAPTGLQRTVTPPGNSTDCWEPAIEAADAISVADLAGTAERLVVLGAHPDDETIGAGRLIALWTRQGRAARAITLSAGEACVDHLGVTIAGLAAQRLAEWRAAMRTLGVSSHSCWDVADGHVDEAVDQLAARLGCELDTGDLLLAPWRHDPHPDHAAAGEIARRAAHAAGCAVVEYPIWMSYWCEPAQLQRTAYRVLRVDKDEAAGEAREVALAHYVSQRYPLRPDLLPVVPAAMLAHHRCQLILRPKEPC